MKRVVEFEILGSPIYGWFIGALILFFIFAGAGGLEKIWPFGSGETCETRMSAQECREYQSIIIESYEADYYGY